MALCSAEVANAQEVALAALEQNWRCSLQGFPCRIANPNRHRRCQAAISVCTQIAEDPSSGPDAATVLLKAVSSFSFSACLSDANPAH